MALLSRTIFLEISTSAALGSALFLLIIFLQQASRLFSILVNSAASAGTVGYLFLLLLPASLPYTVPLGALAGTLIALSRMSNDGEIIALRAAGVPSRRVARPVVLFALLATAITGYCSIKFTPWCQAEVVRVLNRVGPSQLTAEIMPRVFDESFPNTILYVSDVLTGSPVHWKDVFIADTTPPDQRKSAAVDRGEGPRLTLAREALVLPDNRGNRLQLSLSHESGYEVAPDAATYYHINAPRGEMALEAQDRSPQRKAAVNAMSTTTLVHEARKSVEAAIELHRRLALPLACLLLALTGVPLGVSSRKGGKSAAFAITVFLAFLYYTVLLGLIGLAKDGRLNPAIAVWTPNAIFALLSGILLARLELPQGRERFGVLRARLRSLWQRLRRLVSHRPEALAWAASPPRTALLPAAADHRHLRPDLVSFLLRHPAGRIRRAHRGLQFLRAAGRRLPQRHPHERVAALPLLPGAQADLRHRAGRGAGGIAGDVRHPGQEQRDHRPQGLRRQSLPAHSAGAGHHPDPERRALRLRPLRRDPGQHHSGRAAQ